MLLLLQLLLVIIVTKDLTLKKKSFAEKSKVVRIPISIAEEVEREIKRSKRDTQGQLEWWIMLGMILERDFPEYLDEVIKKIPE
jgi:hypothetical protein